MREVEGHQNKIQDAGLKKLTETDYNGVSYMKYIKDIIVGKIPPNPINGGGGGKLS